MECVEGEPVTAVEGRFTVLLDDAHGARWSSLVDPDGQEWLESRSIPERADVRPGDGFVDAGGLEECLPTLRGEPDHGLVWSRPWDSLHAGCSRVTTAEFTLTREVVAGHDVRVSYELIAQPGWRFLWAAHLMLRPTVGTTLCAPARSRVRSFPIGSAAGEGSWPDPPGLAGFDTVPPDDGTALFVTLPGLSDLGVRCPRRGTLRFDLDAPGQPYGFGVWRNLRGFPAAPATAYRSLVVEPMIGHVPALGEAREGECGVVPAGGVVRWNLVLSHRSSARGGAA